FHYLPLLYLLLSLHDAFPFCALSFSNQTYLLDIQTENAAIARRIYSLIKALYDLPIELLVRKKMKLKKNNVYIVRLKYHVYQLLDRKSTRLNSSHVSI